MTGFQTAYEDGDIITVLGLLRTVCMGSNDGELSYKPYKACMAIKSMNNFTIPKPTDPFYYVDELKTKFAATKALTGSFPNGTIFMETLLAEDGLSITDWYAMNNANKLIWEARGDKLNMAILFLCGCKSEQMKKDLRVSFAQGNTTCYPRGIEEMARIYDVEYKSLKKLINLN